MKKSKLKKATNRICVLVVYFGEWPIYFQLFLDSCRKNPEIDFLFISDCGLSEEINSLPNCTYLSSTLQDVSSLLESKLDVKTELSSGYKMCDIRPAYGILWEESLLEYDYWGLCDIDLVFGRIPDFTEDLEKFDYFSVVAHWTSGSLMLFRNIDSMNRLFMESPDWRQVFQTRKYLAFDECSGSFAALKSGKNIEEVNAPITSLSHLVFRKRDAGELVAHFRSIAHEGVPQRYLTVNSSVSDQGGREYIHFHYITAKATPFFVYPNWEVVPETYYISRFGFHHRKPLFNGVSVLFHPNSIGQIASHMYRKLRKLFRKLLIGDFQFIARDLKRRILRK